MGKSMGVRPVNRILLFNNLTKQSFKKLMDWQSRFLHHNLDRNVVSMRVWTAKIKGKVR